MCSISERGIGNGRNSMKIHSDAFSDRSANVGFPTLFVSPEPQLSRCFWVPSGSRYLSTSGPFPRPVSLRYSSLHPSLPVWERHGPQEAGTFSSCARQATAVVGEPALADEIPAFRQHDHCGT